MTTTAIPTPLELRPALTDEIAAGRRRVIDRHADDEALRQSLRAVGLSKDRGVWFDQDRRVIMARSPIDPKDTPTHVAVFVGDQMRFSGCSGQLDEILAALA